MLRKRQYGKSEIMTIVKMRVKKSQCCVSGSMENHGEEVFAVAASNCLNAA